MLKSALVELLENLENPVALSGAAGRVTVRDTFLRLAALRFAGATSLIFFENAFIGDGIALKLDAEGWAVFSRSKKISSSLVSDMVTLKNELGDNFVVSYQIGDFLSCHIGDFIAGKIKDSQFWMSGKSKCKHYCSYRIDVATLKIEHF